MATTSLAAEPSFSGSSATVGDDRLDGTGVVRILYAGRRTID